MKTVRLVEESKLYAIKDNVHDFRFKDHPFEAKEFKEGDTPEFFPCFDEKSLPIHKLVTQFRVSNQLNPKIINRRLPGYIHKNNYELDPVDNMRTYSKTCLYCFEDEFLSDYFSNQKYLYDSLDTNKNLIEQLQKTINDHKTHPIKFMFNQMSIIIKEAFEETWTKIKEKLDEI